MKTISARTWSARQRRARDATRLREHELPEGWSVSREDPARLFEFFPPLRLREGFVLKAYQFTEGGNGNGFVHALPEGTPLPDPRSCAETRDDHFLTPPVPPGALENVMEAVEGDGSLESYFAASLLDRELTEFGALWHGLSWSTHILLDGNPYSTDPKEALKSLDPNRFHSPRDPDHVEFLADPPKIWSPTVREEEDLVTVTFHTYSGLGRDALFRHEDRFARGSYLFEPTEIMIAEGEGGYVF
ncbi:MAG: hypothetical protein ACYTHN_24195 [Planctomycetota bacterium]|jgi:hypothetical protein